MATKKEVLQLADTLREKLGPKAAREFPISDDWGEATNLAALLIQDPRAWGSHLTDDITDKVYATIRGWLNRG